MSRYRLFGLTREPFDLAPDLAFQAPALGQTDALARLRAAITDRAALTIVTGEPGIGKSMVRLALERELRTMPAVRVATLDRAGAWSTDVTFLRTVAAALGAPSTGRTTLELTSEIQHLLGAIVADDHWPVLIIDDAHRLTSSQLELVRAILGPDARPTPVSLLLVGEPELDERVNRRRTLARRLAMRHTLNPLNPRDAEGLIAHRLRVAGLDVDQPMSIFDEAAMRALTERARGNPRALLTLAAAAIDGAAARGAGQIDAEIALRAFVTDGEEDRNLQAPGGKR